MHLPELSPRRDRSPDNIIFSIISGKRFHEVQIEVPGLRNLEIKSSTATLLTATSQAL